MARDVSLGGGAFAIFSPDALRDYFREKLADLRAYFDRFGAVHDFAHKQLFGGDQSGFQAFVFVGSHVVID
jgi:hypothetical protein